MCKNSFFEGAMKELVKKVRLSDQETKSSFVFISLCLNGILKLNLLARRSAMLC